MRVNDRGPFHDGRVIDLSYAAAVKLGVYPAGTARVEVRALTVNDRGPDMRVAAPDPVPPPAVPSAMDRMVSALPIASAEAGERKPANAEVEPAPPGPWRFDMRQDGKAMTADEFDKWMKERQVRVATGKSGTPDKRAPVEPVKPPVRVDTAASNAPPPSPVPKPPQAGKGDRVVLQIASFAARGNAERALAMLEGAGIRDARLLDATAAGQKVWRLRVGPVPGEQVAELSATVAGLGFGRPNIVRD